MESETQVNRRVEQLANRAFSRRIPLPQYGDLAIWVAPLSNTTRRSSCSPADPAVIENMRLFQCKVNLANVSYGWNNERVFAF